MQPIHSAGLDRLRESDIVPVACPAPDMPTVAGMIGGCEAVITRNAGLSSAAFEAAENLRVVVVHGAGHDHVDTSAAARRNVMICNTPGTNARSVAELALGLSIAAARGLAGADRAERSSDGRFRESRSFVELSGKTALIVGWGAVGRTLAGMLHHGLGMDVLICSSHAKETGGYERVKSLMDGIARSDLVSLHTPLREDNHHLFGEAAFAAMKPGAIFVNTARAGLVDETALLDALQTEKVGAAALDVYSPDAPIGPLASLPQVSFSPHLGGTTEDALRRTALAASEHVVEALKGGVPRTLLNAADIASDRSYPDA